jgi:asparagine synthase (glutamine-hydrolysing)
MPAVSNVIWVDGSLAPVTAGMADLLEDPDQARRVTGQFALHETAPGGEHVFMRDRLGVNKLFITARADGSLDWSNYWIDLVERGARAVDVWSVPAGHILRIAPARQSLRSHPYAALTFTDGGDTSEPIAARIQRRLAETFRALREAAAGRPLYVALSGGLDSTVVAVLAREWLGSFTAVTFAVADDVSSDASLDDLSVARRVAADLGVPHLVVTASPADLVGLVDDVLRYGQDWREFNVHCGVVNAAIARAIAAVPSAGIRPLLLTGDVMNELMADYAPVLYGGREYYSLPRLPGGRLRRYLVRGLDAGDREIGIFARVGVDAVQPYALAADAYAAVPASLIEGPHAKGALVRQVMGSGVPAYVYDRPKVRAQVGSAAEVRGTLAIFAAHGLDAAALETRFATLFGLDRRDLPRMIRAGVYRCPASYQVLGAQELRGFSDGARPAAQRP